MLYEEFPNIPEAAASDVLCHSFLKGSGRVGRTRTLSDESRINLAVNAHIRHKLTAYDSILASARDNKGRENIKRAAREQVHHQIQLTADSWRRKKMVSPNEQPKNDEMKLGSAAGHSATTLASNRSRRKAQVEPRSSQTERQSKVVAEIPVDELLDIVADQMEFPPAIPEGKGLESALQSLTLGKSRKKRLSKQQRRYAAIEELNKLSGDLNNQKVGRRLTRALKRHENKGSEMATPHSTSAVPADSQVRAKMNDRAIRRARRAAVRDEEKYREPNRERAKPSKRELNLLREFQRNPNMRLGEKKKRRVLCLLEEEERNVLVRGTDGSLKYAPNYDTSRRPSDPNSTPPAIAPGDSQRPEREDVVVPPFDALADRSVGQVQGHRTLSRAQEARTLEEDLEWMDIS